MKLRSINGVEFYTFEIFEKTYLKESKIIDFIEENSSISIENEEEIIKQKGMEGLK